MSSLFKWDIKKNIFKGLIFVPSLCFDVTPTRPIKINQSSDNVQIKLVLREEDFLVQIVSV